MHYVSHPRSTLKTLKQQKHRKCRQTPPNTERSTQYLIMIMIIVIMKAHFALSRMCARWMEKGNAAVSETLPTACNLSPLYTRSTRSFFYINLYLVCLLFSRRMSFPLFGVHSLRPHVRSRDQTKCENMEEKGAKNMAHNDSRITKW